MKNRVAVLVITLLSLPMAGFAQSAYDTLYTAPVGPGVVYTRLYDPSVPFNVSVLEIDLRNPHIRMETVKGQDLLTGFETISSMASRSNYNGHIVVGAVNGDLYGSMPTNVQVENGEMLLKTTGETRIGFDDGNHVSLSIVSYSGKLQVGASSYSIGGINEPRGTNEMVLYNSYMGISTHTNQYGTEAAIHPIDRWYVNDSVACIVDSVVGNVGNMQIIKGNAVLSGNGAAGDFLANNLRAGDTVEVALSLSPSLKALTEMIGGFPRIVYNGTNYVSTGVAQEGAPDPYNPNPRTGVGFSADSSKLYLVTVDGRNGPLTLGMTLDQFADLMIQLGVYNGMNFDGGGSTTMVLHNSVVNYIAGERAVSNGLMIIADVLSDSVVHSIRLLPSATSHAFTFYKMRRVFAGDSTALEVSGYDKYYNPVPIDQQKVVIDVDPKLGRINSRDYFIASTQHDSGYIYARYDSLVDSEFVVVKTLDRISVSPANVVTDTSRPISFSAKGFDTDNVQQPLDGTYLKWTTSDTAVGIVDTNGLFSGKRGGTTYVAASYQGLKDSVDVTVQVEKGFVQIDSLQSLDGWGVSSLNVDTAATRVIISSELSSIGTRSVEISYRFKFNGNPDYIFLSRNIPLAGVPDSIWIDLKADHLTHSVVFTLTDAAGIRYSLLSKVGSDSTKFTSLPAPVSSYSSAMVFPVTLNKIGVLLGGGTRRHYDSTYTGTIYIDNLRLSYPEHATGISEMTSTPQLFSLLQNYPNPFNPTTTIKYVVSSRQYVVLSVYDVLGRKVATLVNGNQNSGNHSVTFDASRLPSGVYFYRLNAGTYTATKKMLVIK